MYWNEDAMTNPSVLVFARVLKRYPTCFPSRPSIAPSLGPLPQYPGKSGRPATTRAAPGVVSESSSACAAPESELGPAPEASSATACAAPTYEPGEIRKGLSKRTC